MTIQNMHPSWRQFKRQSKLTPAIVQAIYATYVQELKDHGVTTPYELEMVRHQITNTIAVRFNLSRTHLRKILSRTSWGEQPIPDGWIPYI